MEPHEIQNQLAYFTGTEHYHKVYPNLVLTDGVKFLADACGAYWLMDVIWSYLPQVKDTFAVVRFEVSPDREASFILGDDNPPQTVYAKQQIEWTDFPLEGVTLYVIRDVDFWVVLLPSEY